MEKIGLSFDRVVASARARHSDPITSHKAAAKAVLFATGHAGRILTALRTHGPLAPCQMFEFTGLDTAQCDRRRKEMVEAGLVRLTGLVVQGCSVWEAA